MKKNLCLHGAALLLIFLCFGHISAQKAGTKAKPKPKTSKSTSKDANSKFKPDPNYEKYLHSNRIGIRSNALSLNLAAPVQGYITLGYQRKLHRHIMAEVGGGPGIMSPIFSDYDIYNNICEAAAGDVSSGSTLSYVGMHAPHPQFQTYGILTYCFTGPLVNYNYGVGLYVRYRSLGVDWAFTDNKKGTIHSLGYGINLQSQTMISGRIGWGWALGIGPEKITIKQGYYTNPDTKEVVIKDAKGVSYGVLFQLKLNVIL